MKKSPVYKIANDFRRRMLRFNASARGTSMTTAEFRKLQKMMKAEFQNTLYELKIGTAHLLEAAPTRGRKKR